jgi:hypothetical protein
MTKDEISRHNEALFIQKVRAWYGQGNLYEAAKLCQDFQGVDAREAFKRVKMICETEQKGKTK